MKKLMTVIAAVATAFGLFADATNYKTSFEVGEDGVSGDGKIYAPETAGWTGIEEELTLGGYAGDAYTYPTDEVAGNTRRDDFPQKAAQANFLTLDTGTNSLDRAITKEAKDIFIDQLVKFTGFEDPQTNVVAGTKIAVWMGEFVTNETDNAEFTETNLYVTVGAEDVTGPVAVKILGNYELGKWYRLTIKSIGDIFGGQAATARSGFLVFVDGKPATIDTTAEGYVDLISQVGKLSGAAAAAYTANRLFPAITAGGEMLASVGYQGIGAIDDVYIDELGPEFARFVDVTFADITGATITKVVDSDGNEFTDFSKAISVKQGQLTVTLAAKPGWILKITDPKVVNTADAVGGVITVELQEGDVVEAVAKIGTEYFETLEEALAAVKDGDTVEILKQATSADGNYSFTPNTTIAVTEGGNWAVYIGSYVEEEETVPGKLTDKAGVMPEKQIVVTGVEDSVLELAGAIQGNGRVETRVIAPNVVLVGTLTIGAAEGNGALLKADEIAFGTSRKPQTIALIGKGKVMTKDGTLTEEQITVPAGEQLEVSGQDADGYYTYQIAGTFTVTFLNCDDTEYAVSNDVPYNTAFNDVKPKVNPTKEGDYTFAGWIPAGEPVISNSTYKATFTLNTYEITWEESENVVATNNGAQVASGITLAKDETITFYPTVGSITNIVVDGEAVSAVSPYTFTVKAQASVLKVLAGVTAAPSPTPVDPSQGTIVSDGEGNFVINPTGNEITVNNPGDNKFIVDVAADFTIKGVAAANITVKCNGENITSYCKGGDAEGFSTELDPAKTTPELIEASATEQPLVVGTTVDLKIKQSVLGLAYKLLRVGDVGDFSDSTKITTATTVKGTGEALTLVDEHKPANKAFYKVAVGKGVIND